MESRIVQAVESSFGDVWNRQSNPDGKINAMVFTGKPEFGDYQCNIAMTLAKQLKLKPRDVAQKILDCVTQNGENSVTKDTMNELPLIKEMDISGPGFLNIHLDTQYVQSKVHSMLGDNIGSVSPYLRLGVAPAAEAVTDVTVDSTIKRQSGMTTRTSRRVVVDFSSPNIAKEMHVVKYAI